MNILTSGRFWLAGPGAFVLALLVLLGMAVWFPKGPANLNNIALPMMGFPLIWAVLFFYAYLDRRPSRVSWIFAGLAAAHLALLINHFVN